MPLVVEEVTLPSTWTLILWEKAMIMVMLVYLAAMLMITMTCLLCVWCSSGSHLLAAVAGAEASDVSVPPRGYVGHRILRQALEHGF